MAELVGCLPEEALRRDLLCGFRSQVGNAPEGCLPFWVEPLLHPVGHADSLKIEQNGLPQQEASLMEWEGCTNVGAILPSPIGSNSTQSEGVPVGGFVVCVVGHSHFPAAFDMIPNSIKESRRFKRFLKGTRSTSKPFG